ncbi:MAG: YtxH domain-containing protein [Bacteroidales bacterium]|nr:YtxH domain-containing protein [Bacteroidales bacterium]
METTDKTILEMQEQMKELREKLESQKIVNDSLLRKSFRQNASRLKSKANIPLIFGVAAILLAPSYLNIGASWISVVVTWVLMLICIVATIICNRHIPQMDRDLVTAAEELTKFKKFHAEWLKFAIPAIIIWLGILIWDILRGEQMSQAESIGFFAGLAVGATLGLIIGLKMRRDQLDAADDLLDQIEDLRAEKQ